MTAAASPPQARLCLRVKLRLLLLVIFLLLLLSLPAHRTPQLRFARTGAESASAVALQDFWVLSTVAAVAVVTGVVRARTITIFCVASYVCLLMPRHGPPLIVRRHRKIKRRYERGDPCPLPSLSQVNEVGRKDEPYPPLHAWLWRKHLWLQRHIDKTPGLPMHLAEDSVARDL